MMDFIFLWKSIKNIINDPAKEWDLIRSENRSVNFISIYMLLPLLILVTVSAFLGSFFFINTGLSKVYALMTGLKYFIHYFLVIYVTSLILKWTSKILYLPGDFNISFKIISFSAVPLLLCQIVSRIFESFIFINVLALYGLYIFWIGIEKMIDPPENRKIQLLVINFVAFIAVTFLSDWILTHLADRIYFAVLI